MRRNGNGQLDEAIWIEGFLVEAFLNERAPFLAIEVKGGCADPGILEYYMKAASTEGLIMYCTGRESYFLAPSLSSF